MKFTAEELGEVDPVTEQQIATALADDAFGKFAVLERSDGSFMQVGNNWQPGEACIRFMAETGSEPWILEYREAGRLFRARGDRTLDEVIAAFREYFSGDDSWRSRYWWLEHKLRP